MSSPASHFLTLFLNISFLFCVNMFCTLHARCIFQPISSVVFHDCLRSYSSWRHSHLFISLHIVMFFDQFCYLSLSVLFMTLCGLFTLSPTPTWNFCYLLSLLFCCSRISCFLLNLILPFIYLACSLFLISINMLFFWAFSLALSSLLPCCVSPSFAVCLTLCVSEPMVVCTTHPPASHSAPSFLRQYAGHLGRTALRREPGGGLERDRAHLSLHRTGSLGTHTHAHACAHTHTILCYEKIFNAHFMPENQK